MIAQPLTERCARVLERRAHAVLGISPFNSYFSEVRIRTLCAWALSNFEAVHLFVPDIPSAWTLEALGYKPDKARRKARRQASWLRNKILRALAAAGVPEERGARMILDWAALDGYPRYRQSLRRCERLFHDQPSFRRACLDTARWVLEGRIAAAQLPDSAVEHAARYFLAELPLFIESTVILGQPASVFCYHQVPTFLRRLYSGEQVISVQPNQGFVRLRDAVTAAA